MSIDVLNCFRSLCSLYRDQGLTNKRAETKARKTLEKAVQPILQSWVNEVIETEGYYGFHSLAKVNVSVSGLPSDGRYIDYQLHGVFEEINVYCLDAIVEQVARKSSLLDYNGAFQARLQPVLSALIAAEQDKQTA